MIAKGITNYLGLVIYIYYYLVLNDWCMTYCLCIYPPPYDVSVQGIPFFDNAFDMSSGTSVISDLQN